jgi:hypothetical protein
MAPIIGKLICNNKNVIEQRDEDTAAMMDMILRKRSGDVVESSNMSLGNVGTSSHNEMLEIAETIRELAIKLQIQRERCNAAEVNLKLNDSLTRSLDHIQKSIIHKPGDDNKEVYPLVQEKSAGANKTLKTNQEGERFVDIDTPKAGNLSMRGAKTPLHSNLSRHQQRVRKDETIPSNGVYPNPYPLTSKNVSPTKIIAQSQITIDESLVNLRVKLARAKTMEFHNENHKATMCPQSPMSTKNQRSVSRSRVEGFYIFQSNEKEGLPSTFYETSNKPLQKLRSLSTGRAAQHGIQFINRFLQRREDQDDTVGKSLTSSSSDSMQEPVALAGSRKHSTVSDESINLVVNRHCKS